MTPSAPESDAQYCADAVRRHDPDRYLLALFQPAAKRQTALALAAWNLELANARQRSGEVLIGQMRLQWHRDALQEIRDGRPRRHPVVGELAAAHGAGVLDLDCMLGIVDARERDLDPAPPANLADLEAYGRATAGALNACLWPSLPAAIDSGAAFALIGLARAAPANEAAGRRWTPADLKGDLRPIVTRGGELAAAALKAGPKPAVAPALLARAYARRALAVGCDPTSARMAGPDPWRLWRLMAFRFSPF